MDVNLWPHFLLHFIQSHQKFNEQREQNNVL